MSEVPGLDERGRHRRKRGFAVADRFIPSRRAQGVALVRAQGPQEGPCSDLGLALRALRLPRKLRTVRLNRRRVNRRFRYCGPPAQLQWQAACPLSTHGGIRQGGSRAKFSKK